MQLIIKHQVPGGLSLPINYNHILQAMIFRHLSDNDCRYRNIHDDGQNYEKRQYKLFVFSLIRGKYQIKGKKIVFVDYVEYEVRSPDAKLIQTIAKSMKENGITYGDVHFDDVELKIVDYEVEDNCITIQMLSPLCVYSTDKENGFTHYYAPKELEFARLIRDNFQRKYQAYCGVWPEGEIEIVPEQIKEKDKFITRYKKTYINGWNGKYLLKGPRKYLDFLYQAGIGSKNSQGFGMFEIVK